MRELLERLFQVDFIKGLLVTFRMQNPKEIVTEQYPLERPMVAERYRGAPRLNNHPETGETLCIGCNLCALACPENLIVVGWLRDDATRRKVLTHFTYDTSRCMFCGLCNRPFRRLGINPGFRNGLLHSRRSNLGPPPFGAGAHTRALYPLKIMHGTSQRSHHAKLGHPGTKRSCCGDCGAVSLRAGKDRESSRHHDLACRGALAGTSRSTP